MNQIKSIQVGIIAICFATLPLSLAQMPRIRTSGSNQTTATTTVAPIHTGSNGNLTRAPQIGINPGNAAITRTTPNIGAHTATNPGVQTGISNHAIGITSAATAKSGSTGNSTIAAEAGTNAATGTNTTANTKAGAQIGSTVDTRTVIDIVEPGSTPALILFTSTPTPTPVPTPTPIPSPSVSPSPSPSP
jgi:hypothetical protein